MTVTINVMAAMITISVLRHTEPTGAIVRPDRELPLERESMEFIFIKPGLQGKIKVFGDELMVSAR